MGLNGKILLAMGRKQYRETSELKAPFRFMHILYKKYYNLLFENVFSDISNNV